MRQIFRQDYEYGGPRELEGIERQASLAVLASIYGWPVEQLEARIARGETLYTAYARYFRENPIDVKPDPE